MAKQTTKTGKALERQVADTYRAMGARKVEHDVEIAGHQIDVYVEMETADRALHRIAVEAKDYIKPVGIEIVAEFAVVVDGLRRLKLVDEGVIVSAAGFSKQARNAAKEHGLRLLESADLATVAGLPDLVQMRTDYLASLRQRFEYLDLGGIAPRVQNRTVKLRMEDVFIPMQARPELEARDEWTDEVEEELALRMSVGPGEDLQKAVEIPDLLDRQRVVILGDPGCGKSTLLRHVAYAVASGTAGNVGEATMKRLPIFVRIVDFSQVQAHDRALTLDTYIREVCEPRWASLFQWALDTGEALVLLDGLDEVVDAHQRKAIAEAILRLVADYPGNVFLVTSRIVGYRAARLGGDFAHYTIQPLPLEHIAEFVEKWYAAIEREAGETELSEKARQRAAELSRTIQERPGIRRLAGNPLLLTIIALVNWRGRRLPNRRVELYTHAAETLIESWPYRRQGVELDTEQVIRLLSPVAYRIFAAHSSGNIAEDELLSILAGIIHRADGVSEPESNAYAAEFLKQISERSGIFCEQGYDKRGRRVFGFLHLTFGEYFAARYLAGLWEGMENGEGRRKFLRKYARVPRWHEVVLLLAGDVGLRDNDRAERATHLLGDILKMDSEHEEQLHRDMLLAGECLGDGLRVQPAAENYVLDRLSKLTLKPGMGQATRTIFEAMRGTASGEYVLGMLRKQLENENSLGRYRTARALEVLGDKRSVDVLVELLTDEDKRIRASAAGVLGVLGDERATQGLQARLEDSEGEVRAEVATALGMLGNTHAVEALQQLLQDKDESVRIRALGALEALGALGDVRAHEPVLRPEAVGDTEAIQILIAQLEDKHWVTRWRAARALGKLGNVQAARPLLAWLEDESAAVQDSVMQALGRLNAVCAVGPLLAKLKDERWWIRVKAAEALGRIGDTRAVEALLTLLEDEREEVQLRAAEALGRIGDVRAVEPLLARLEADVWWAVQSRSRRALVAILNRNVPEPTVEEESVSSSPVVSGPWDSQPST